MTRKNFLLGTGILMVSTSMALHAREPFEEPAKVAVPAISALSLRLPRGIVAGPSVEGVSEYRLRNGLTILLYPDGNTPTTTVNVTYRVGAANEDYGETGMAHLLEHLVFKGTPSIANIGAEFKKRGIAFNGTTGQDRTNYYGSFPANDQTLEWMLRAEADRMVNADIARKDLDSEMTVVRNEMEIGENRPGQVLNQRLRSQAFLWHKYGQSPIGNRSDVENVPIERLQAFYRKWYQPDTATVMVAGAFDPAKVLKIMNDSFGRIKRPTRTLPPRYTLEPTQDGAREIEVRRAGERNLMAVGYHVPAFTHPDSPALEVLADIMNDSPSGRLEKSLVETKLALGTDTSVDEGREPGLVVFYASATPGVDASRVEQTLIEQIEARDGKPFSDEEVNDAKTRLANRYRRVNNNVTGLGHMISDYIGIGDWRLLFYRRDRIATVSTDDVNRVAQAYLKPSNRTLARFIPTSQPDRAAIDAAPSAETVLKDFTGGPVTHTGERFPTDARAILTQTEYTTLGSGLKVALVPRATRGQLITLTMMAHFGDDTASMRNGDAPNFLSALLMSGTKTMTKEQVARRIEQLDARISISSAGRFAAIRLTSPRDTFDDALRLIVDILRNPALSEEEFERTRARSIAALESEERSPGTVADEAMNKFFDRYPKGHADAFRTSEEKLIALKTTTIDQVRAFHREYFGTADGEAAVIGDFDPAHMKALLTAELTGWHSRHPHSHKPEPYSQPATVVRQSIETPDKANAVIVSRSNIDMNVTNPDYPALVIAAQIFGSGVMSSRLGTRVRGREGLSYYVGGNVIIDPIDTNSIFYMQATSAPENMPKVEAGMREELARFVRDGVTERELADAKEGMLATYADRRSSDIGLAGALRGEMFHGRTLEWTADMEDRMRALTVEQVNAVIRRYIKPGMVSTFVAGDFDRVRKQVTASTK